MKSSSLLKYIFLPSGNDSSYFKVGTKLLANVDSATYLVGTVMPFITLLSVTTYMFSSSFLFESDFTYIKAPSPMFSKPAMLS